MSLCPLRRSGVVVLALSTTLAAVGVSGTAFAATKPAAKRAVATKPAVTKTAATKTIATKQTAAVLSNAPTGQTTLTGLLPAAASAFGSVLTGWSSYAGGVVAQIPSIGRSALGALSVVSNGPWTGASSSTFAVTPGTRYSANTWAEALTAGHSVGLALQFRDATGATIGLGTQLGQPVTDTTSSWTQTPAVVGIAPAGAVSAVVIFVDYDGAAGDVQRLDDVAVSGTSGVAAKIVGAADDSGHQRPRRSRTRRALPRRRHRRSAVLEHRERHPERGGRRAVMGRELRPAAPGGELPHARRLLVRQQLPQQDRRDGQRGDQPAACSSCSTCTPTP